MSLVQDLQLNEVIEPAPFDQWPVAIGWWILLAVILMTVFLVIRWGLKLYRRKKMQRVACLTLSAQWSQYQASSRFGEFRQAANLVLKQHCIQLGLTQVAAMTAAHWQQFLIEQLPAKHHDAIEQFCRQLYCAVDNNPQDAEAVYHQTQQWIRGLKC